MVRSLRRLPALLSCWVVLAAASLAAAEAPAPSLEGVMAELAASGGVRARFVERKHLALLSEPLESAGRLYFAPPDRLARITERPGRARMVIRGDRLAMSDEAGEERIDLDQSDIARQLVENVMVVLRGDLATLRERYELAFASDGTGWQLRLVPRNRVLRRFVTAIDLAGEGPALRSMVVSESNGDRTETLFSEVETGVVFTPAERERLFALGGAP